MIQDIFQPGSISGGEQETYISFNRDEEFATVYTSDTTQINRLNKLCKQSKFYLLIKSTKYGNTYKITDKSLVSLRSTKTTRELTEEQKEAARERFAKARENQKKTEN